MTAGNVPTTNLNALYANTTSSQPADPAIFDAAMQDVVQTINDNYAYAAGLVASDKVSNLGIINVKDYEAKGDGVTDDTAEIQSAIDTANAAGGGAVIFPTGNYLVGSLTGRDKVSLIGNNATLTKNGGATGTSVINLTGSTTSTTQALSANASLGTQTLTVGSTAGFSVGDYVLVYDNTYKYVNSGNFGRNQEINRITAVTATTITLANRTIGAYNTASTATVTKLSAITKVRIEGITIIIPSGTNGGGVYGLYNVGTALENCHVVGPNDRAGILFEQSSRINVNRCSARDGQNVASGGYGYGFSFNESCHHSQISNSYTENARENNFTNNTRYCSFVDNICVSMYDTGFNTHGSGNESILIKGNVISSSNQYGIAVGFSTHNAGDFNIVIEGNMITDSNSTAISISSPVGKEGQHIQMVGNSISNPCIGGSAQAVVISQAKHVTFVGNKVYGKNNNVSYGIYAINSSAVDIIGNKVDSVPNNYGIGYNTCTDLVIADNTITNIASYVVRSQGTNTNVVVKNNKSDAATVSFQANDRRSGNVWGTKYDDNRGAAATVADGGTITHNLVSSPTWVTVTGSLTNQFVSVTAISATTFTVAIKKDDGTAGTAQTIYWQAGA